MTKSQNPYARSLDLWQTLKLSALGLVKIPVLFFVRPRVAHVDDNSCAIRIPLNWRTRNHVGCMYFGVLCVGADIAGGMLAWLLADKAGQNVQILFKDLHADFLKRAEGDVLFTCEDGPAITEMVHRAIESGQRQNMPVRVTARVPDLLGDVPVARFTLTLSLKKK